MWKNIIAIIKIEGKESLIEQARWCRMILRLVPSKEKRRKTPSLHGSIQTNELAKLSPASGPFFNRYAAINVPASPIQLLRNFLEIEYRIVGRISGATRSQNPPINRPSARNGTKRDEAGRPSGERKGDGGGWWRGEQSYVMNTLYLRFQGMLAHAPMGWLHPVLHRDPPCLSLSLSLLHPSSTPRSS